MNEFERLMTDLYDDGIVAEVIRPAAILPEEAARLVIVELAMRDIDAGGLWHAETTVWKRYVQPRDPDDDSPLEAHLIGTMQVAYGMPTRYEITIYRATITSLGTQLGWTVEQLCNEAIGFGGYALETCPRVHLNPPPAPSPFRLS